MLKIGFLDYYLDNWHANNYPDFMRASIKNYGYNAEVTTAYGLIDAENGLTSAQWCEKQNVRLAESLDDFFADVDAVMVIAADDSRFHEKVCPATLACGKPVFVDKTFAHNLQTAKSFFEIAEKHGTPVFSASAQRYCQDVLDYLQKRTVPTRFISTVGPHSLENYAVHQLEPIVAIMGTGVQRLKCFAVGSAVTQLILDYGDGRLASFTQSPQPWAEFNFMVSDGETGQRLNSDDSNFYDNLMKAILEFFVNGVLPVQKAETLEIISIIETAQMARHKQDEWHIVVSK